ncbi:SoxR reducing system RseC family protein [Clostridium saccharobutylicum]|uniref:Positive regulator of sigma(E), RseC/MucC n=1 Tax=Clostridium saccharobutylicum TaxID=169679 RepID=A0A1S8MP72_CLOSA|nr:SoxR reducing system RseC family protein [Clostridium saccharobutylicum]OOM05951.1 positive regulator of sigma(E), RseC/MucC [Clostridium saccharobutylicum]
MSIKEQKQNNSNDDNKLEGEKKNTNMLVAAFMMFIFPIISVFLGAFIGGYIGKHIGFNIKIFQVVGGIAGFVVSIIAIKLFDKYSKADENVEKIHWDDL